MGLIDQLLVQGADSRLYQSLVQKRGLTGSVSGGANPLLGNMFDIKGPTLWTRLAHSRRRQEGRRHHFRDRRGDHAAAEHAGHERGARARPRQAALAALCRLRTVRRLRPRQPARRLRALRRRPGEDQPARGRVPQGHAGDDPEGGARVPAADQPHDPDHRPERKGELRWRTAPRFIPVLGLSPPCSPARAADPWRVRLRRRSRRSRSRGRRSLRRRSLQRPNRPPQKPSTAKPAAEKPAPKQANAPSRPSRRRRACRATSRSPSRSASRSTTACRSRWCSGERCRRCA